MENSRKSPKLLTNAARYIDETLAAEISAISKYFELFLHWQPSAKDGPSSFNNIQALNKAYVSNFENLAMQLKETSSKNENQLLLLNKTLNYEPDIQTFLSKLRPILRRDSRIVAVIYNSLFTCVFSLLTKMGMPQFKEATLISLKDCNKLAKLSGFEIVKVRRSVYVPFKVYGLGDVLNKWLTQIPLLKHLCFYQVLVLRPIIQEESKPSLSIIVPVRNEKGNLENIFTTLPQFNGVDIEIIFVEGNSTDGSREELERLIALNKEHLSVCALQQKGKGKADAVHLGFMHAKNDLLIILDSDLSTPAKFLENFYAAYCAGLGDFINGSRLVYPLTKGSMAFLNKLGNHFFVHALNFVLGIAISDTLCGTKLFSRKDYQRFCQWRKAFGELDPFGDFDFLFPAAIMGLGIIDVPVRYYERTYGSTNIHRFTDGFKLLKMVTIGFFRISLGHTTSPKYHKDVNNSFINNGTRL